MGEVMPVKDEERGSEDQTKKNFRLLMQTWHQWKGKGSEAEEREGQSFQPDSYLTKSYTKKERAILLHSVDDWGPPGMSTVIASEIKS